MLAMERTAESRWQKTDIIMVGRALWFLYPFVVYVSYNSYIRQQHDNGRSRP